MTAKTKMQLDVERAAARRAVTDAQINKLAIASEMDFIVKPITQDTMNDTIKERPYIKLVKKNALPMARLIEYHEDGKQVVLDYRYSDCRFYLKVHSQCTDLETFLADYGNRWILPLQAQEDGTIKGWAIPFKVKDLPGLMGKDAESCFHFNSGNENNKNRIDIKLPRTLQYYPLKGRSTMVEEVKPLVEVLARLRYKKVNK